VAIVKIVAVMKKVNNNYLIMLLIVLLNQFTVKAAHRDFKLFRYSAAYELAKAVQHQNCRKIEYLIKIKGIDPNSKDSIEESSILYYAMIHRKYRAMEALLKNGANPNVRNICNMTPLTCLSDIWWHDWVNQKKAAMILLKYGADINAKCEYHKNEEKKNAPYKLLCTTPFRSACKAENMGYIGFLITNGADPNIWVCDPMNCAVTNALIQDRMNVVKYLVVDIKVKIPPYCIIRPNNDTITFLRMLREQYFKIGSKNHRYKMEIIDFVKKNYGLDYYKEPIPQGNYMEILRRDHPRDLEEYLKKY
jgi:uncharacterized protein